VLDNMESLFWICCFCSELFGYPYVHLMVQHFQTFSLYQLLGKPTIRRHTRQRPVPASFIKCPKSHLGLKKVHVFSELWLNGLALCKGPFYRGQRKLLPQRFFVDTLNKLCIYIVVYICIYIYMYICIYVCIYIYYIYIHQKS